MYTFNMPIIGPGMTCTVFANKFQQEHVMSLTELLAREKVKPMKMEVLIIYRKIKYS